MRTIFRATIVATLCAAATPALAIERNGYAEIMRGDYASAEQIITAERQGVSNDPDLLLNLATVYMHTNRLAQARDLYQRILSRPDEEMEMTDSQFLSAHLLAKAGLRRIDQTRISAR